jgi:hypothetical protein
MDEGECYIQLGLKIFSPLTLTQLFEIVLLYPVIRNSSVINKHKHQVIIQTRRIQQAKDNFVT